MTLPLDDDGNLDLSGGNPYNVDGDLDTAYTKGFYKHSGLDLATNGVMPELAHLIDKGKVAILANAGNIIQPATKAEIKDGSKPVPPFLFAHNHQATITMNGIASKIKYTDWAGRVYDLWQGINGTTLYRLNMGIDDNSHLFYGDETEPLVIGSSGPKKYGWNIRRDIEDRLMEVKTGNVFGDLYTKKQEHSFKLQDVLYDDWKGIVPTLTSKNAYGGELFSQPTDTQLQQNKVKSSSYLLGKLKELIHWSYIGKITA